MMNPVTGRRCYGGMVPLSRIEEYQPSKPLPPPPEIPEPRTRRPVRELVEESVE